jgi:hypothetical protein
VTADYEDTHERGERAAEEMERRAERLERQIGETRRDWESKQHDDSVPGAQPDEAERAEEHEGADPPPEADITPGD